MIDSHVKAQTLIEKITLIMTGHIEITIIEMKIEPTIIIITMKENKDRDNKEGNRTTPLNIIAIIILTIVILMELLKEMKEITDEL